MTKEYLKFYAKIDGSPDRLFNYSINSIIDLPARLKYFTERYEIKAAWYVCIDGMEKTEQRIDMNNYYQSNCAETNLLPNE
jgi:hypothetical protein